MNGVRRTADTVTVRVPAKLNPGLVIGPRRDDGYHELATLYLAVSCYDRVAVAPADGLRVTVSGPRAARVPADGTNLAAHAARLIARHCGVRPDVHIHITKRIPVLGGMAGGSADAAGTLVACDALWGTALDRAEFDILAAGLGSDVPFCLRGGAALGRGRGERLEPVESAAPYHWVFAVAERGLSTSAVFAEWDRRRRDTRSASTGALEPPNATEVPDVPEQLVKAFRSGDPRLLAGALANDLEPTATAMLPALAGTRAAGLAAGALAGLLCGTGATYAFLADGADGAATVADRLAASGTCASVQVALGPVPGPTSGS